MVYLYLVKVEFIFVESRSKRSKNITDKEQLRDVFYKLYLCNII